MDYGIQNHLSAQPQALLQPQQQQQQQAAALYSAYYSTASANPYPNPIVRHEDPSQSALVFAEGAVAQTAEHYAVEGGFDAQAVSYGAYQHSAVPFPFAQVLGVASFQQANPIPEPSRCSWKFPPPPDFADATAGGRLTLVVVPDHPLLRCKGKLKRKFKVHSNILDLEEKKQKIIEGGASAAEVRVCTICNVACNSTKVFASHLSGEKHALKAYGPNYRTMVPKIKSHIKQMNYAKKSTPKPFTKAQSIAFIPAQSFFCEVCKIECNGQETLNTHKMGKKHKGNLQKLQEKITPKPSSTSVDKNISFSGQDQAATNIESVKKSSSAKESLLTKKEKVVQGGAAEEAIIICALCDIVCNSKTVYESHIAGKKHLSLIKKQDTLRV